MAGFVFSFCVHFTLTSHVTCAFPHRYQGKKYLLRLKEQPGGEKAFPELSQTLRRHCHRQAAHDIDTIYKCVWSIGSLAHCIDGCFFYSAFSLRCQAYLRQNFFREVGFNHFCIKRPRTYSCSFKALADVQCMRQTALTDMHILEVSMHFIEVIVGGIIR